MFINCPGCSALVATDLVTDQPPERCPYCGHALRAAAPAAEAGPSPPPPRPAPASAAEAPPAAGAPGPRFVPLRARPADAEAPAPPPAEAPRPAPAPAPAPDAQAADAPAARPAPPPAGPPRPDPAAASPAPAPAVAPPRRPAAVETGAAAAPARPSPSFLRPRSGHAPAPPRERRAVAIAIPLLLLALGAQLLLADRARLAADPAWRPWVAAACAVARCTLPPWREPAAIALLQRDVRPHPDRPGQLQVAATLRNDAVRAQAWPMLSLTLSDAEGRPLGARWFAPEEYRPAGAADTLAPGESAAFRLDIVEPSPNAVAFNFDFG